MEVYAIDPGSEESAFVYWEPQIKCLKALKMPNEDVLRSLPRNPINTTLYIEMVQCFGMPVGREVFETVRWIGRFEQYWMIFAGPVQLVYRNSIKLHHCHDSRAKDSNIRAALIAKYGEPGRKAAPGVTYGLAGDLWQAFALATYISEGGLEQDHARKSLRCKETDALQT